MKKVLVVLLVLVIAGVAFLYFPRGGLDAANAAILSVMNPAMDAQRTGKQDYVAAIDGDIFATGDLLRSKDVGYGVLTFFDGSTVSVDPATQVRVTALSREGSDGLQVTLEQTSGRISNAVNQLKTPNSRFELRTPTLTALVRGTSFESIVSALGTTIRVHEGQVLVRDAQGREQLLSAGDEITVGPSGISGGATKFARGVLRVTVPAGVQLVLIDPRGFRCGQGDTLDRQIPACTVSGQSVQTADVVAGTYIAYLTAKQAVANGELSASGLRSGATDFTQRLPRSFAAGDTVRATLVVQVAADGKLTAGAFSAPEAVANVCGAEAAGRVFGTGTLEQRDAALRQYASANKGQPAAIVATTEELRASANDALVASGAPITVADLDLKIDPAGLHVAATFSYGPFSIPGKADVTAGAVDGKLVIRVRSLSAPPVPQAVMDQLARSLEDTVTEAADLPMVVGRVAWRDGCVGVLGRTSP